MKPPELIAMRSHTKPRHRPGKTLPPYGRQWLEAGAKYGPFVVFGPGAWDIAERRKRSGFVLVCPSDRDPLEFDWSLLSGRATVVIEAGSFDTPRLERIAYALLTAGVPLVHPIRVPGLSDALPLTWASYARDDYEPV